MLYREWLDAPCGLLESIVEANAYTKAKAYYDSVGGDEKKLKFTSLMRQVQHNDFLIAREDIDAQRRRSG